MMCCKFSFVLAVSATLNMNISINMYMFT
jgi:hypothetical protein